jgi:hypothetical protein
MSYIIYKLTRVTMVTKIATKIIVPVDDLLMIISEPLS